MNLVEKIYRTIAEYNIKSISGGNIQKRKFRILNISMFFISLFSLLNVFRYYYLGDQSIAFFFLTISISNIILLLTQRLRFESKVMTMFMLLLITTFILSRLIERDNKVSDVFGLFVIASTLFLKGKRYYFIMIVASILFYINFFYLKQYVYTNVLSFLPYILLSFVFRGFILDSEKNEEIISKQVEELKQTDELKTKLFANISHEIRTPLTLILGANEQLEISKQSGIIKKNGQRMLELVNQILDLSKIEANQRKIHLISFTIDNYFSDFIVSFQNYAEFKKVTFDYINKSNFENVYIDKDAINKIVSNLLANAFKFTSEGDFITLIIENTNDNWLKISVTDTGMGIEQERIDFVFNQFYHSTVGLEASSGIGLALVKELVDSLGGTVSVSSKENMGTTFTVLLPTQLKQFEDLGISFIEVEDTSNEFRLIEEFEEVTKNELEVNSEKEILLLVEDNDDLREFISDLFSPDYQVLQAINGEEGIKKAIEHIPDVIISDVMMPKVNGIQLLETLKNEEITSHIPILLLTAKSDENDILKGLSLQADDYITKPFNNEELKLRVKNKITLRNRLQKKYEKPTVVELQKTENISIDDVFLQKIQKEVENNLANENFGPEELASSIGISRSQLHRKIKALTNSSTSIYLRNIRLEFAKIKLANNTATISEIAYDTGFSSLSYFSKCFKEFYGYSPKEFANKNINT